MTAPWADLASSRFSYLAGPAGTGKTFLLKEWAAAEKGVVLTAVTGIASVNLGEGTTINALLKYFDTASLIEQYTAGYLTSRLRALQRIGVRRILVDEVSMMDADQLTVLVRALDEVNGQGYVVDEVEQDKDLPELGLTLAGDFCQLPPVKAKFAFESPEWPRFAEHTVLLTEIRRQTDSAFLRALHAVRQGHPELALETFGPRFKLMTDLHFDGTTIFAKNDAVDRHNQLRLDRLKGEPLVFTSTRWGEQRSEWKQIPDQLRVKVGALVMVLANRRAPAGEGRQYEYINGDLGVLIDNTGLVELKRDGRTVRVEDVVRQYLIPLEPGRRKELKAEGLENRIKDKWEVIGEIRYCPLRLAYGTTVHKSQGLTLDRCQISIRDHFFSNPGSLYVALSRCRTLEGIDLVGSPQLFVARGTVDRRVKDWL